MVQRALVWFRRDLRVRDNTALHHAARGSRDGVVGLYLITPEAWKVHDEAPAKVDFWLRNVASLSRTLGELGIPLRVVKVARGEDVTEVVLREARGCGCDALYFNREYEIDELRRDARTAARFERESLKVEGFDDRVAMAPGAVLTGSGTPYTVFTPFRARWYEGLKKKGWAVLAAPSRQPATGVEATAVPGRVEGFASPLDPALWPEGEDHAHARLRAFVKKSLRDYKTLRDRPDLDGTSALSPYLAAGVLSPRQCLAAAARANEGDIDAGNEGVVTWVSELAWRDFYQHVMVAFPRVCMYRAFQPETEAVAWRDAPEDFARWCEGRTGYPLVDAAMRQLRALGWMHNRLRMVTAMFLTKDLLIDWRRGERFFMQHLVDGDLGANNGGWQWAASTGTDAQPWFRVFNPLSQSKRYDPDGRFIHHMVPELKNVPAKALHAIEKVGDAKLRALGYVPRVVDHATARVRAIEAFRALG